MKQEAQSEAPSVDVLDKIFEEYQLGNATLKYQAGIDQAKAKINRLIAKQVVEARLDELTSLDNRRQHPVRNWGEVTDIDGKKHTLIETRRYDWEKTIENRIKELTEQLGEK